MLCPYDPKGICRTQPRVTLKNIILKNVMVDNSLFFPVMIKGNETNLCTQFQFGDLQQLTSGEQDRRKQGQYVSTHWRPIDFANPKIPCRTDTQTLSEETHPNETSGFQEQEYMDINIHQLYDRLYETMWYNPYIDQDDDQKGGQEEFIEEMCGRTSEIQLVL